MEDMKSRDQKKMTQPVGNHPAKWLTDTERFRVVSGEEWELQELRRKIAADPHDAEAMWMDKEGELAGLCRQLTAILRDRLPPATFRQIDDVLDCLGTPEDTTQDVRCWAHFGALDAVSATYSALVTARLAHTCSAQAAAHALTTFAVYKVKAYRLYADVHAQCLLLCPEAEPRSLHVSIADVKGYPVLEMSYKVRPGMEEA